MLNVNVLAGANAEAYYAEAAMSGIEDYRLGTEAPTGVWCASASLLGLSGDIARADLTAAIDDRRPHDVLRGVFSKRRAAIVEELAREGRRSAPAKIVREYDADRRPRWAAEALAAGFPTAQVIGNLTKEPTSRVGPSVASVTVARSNTHQRSQRSSAMAEPFPPRRHSDYTAIADVSLSNVIQLYPTRRGQNARPRAPRTD